MECGKGWLLFKQYGESAEQARAGAVMTWVKHNIRLTPVQDRTLIRLAEQRGLTRYRMLGRIVETGFSSLVNGSDANASQSDMIAEIAAMSVRFAELERVLDRALFAACAGYTYARSSALGQRHSDDLLTGEVYAAYERQRSLASEAAS
jgi:hypothetical protein